MDRVKKHIIHFLALLFIAVQGMGTLHFYVYHQDIMPLFENERGTVVAKPELHQCDFNFFKTPLSLYDFEAIELEHTISPHADNNFNYSTFYVKKHKLTNYLRGPPEALL